MSAKLGGPASAQKSIYTELIGAWSSKPSIGEVFWSHGKHPTVGYATIM